MCLAKLSLHYRITTWYDVKGKPRLIWDNHRTATLAWLKSSHPQPTKQDTWDSNICTFAATRRHSRGKVAKQPIVLVASNRKVSIVGEIDHVSWAHIHRIPQGVVWPTQICVNGHGVAWDIGLELGIVVQTNAILCQKLRLQIVIAVVREHRDPAKMKVNVTYKLNNDLQLQIIPTLWQICQALSCYGSSRVCTRIVSCSHNKICIVDLPGNINHADSAQDLCSWWS